MNKIKYRDYIRVVLSVVFSWLYIPHLISALIIEKKTQGYVLDDVLKLNSQLSIKLSPWSSFFITCTTTDIIVISSTIE